jgi:hypothetical protein
MGNTDSAATLDELLRKREQLRGQFQIATIVFGLLYIQYHVRRLLGRSPRISETPIATTSAALWIVGLVLLVAWICALLLRIRMYTTQIVSARITSSDGQSGWDASDRRMIRLLEAKRDRVRNRSWISIYRSTLLGECVLLLIALAVGFVIVKSGESAGTGMVAGLAVLIPFSAALAAVSYHKNFLSVDDREILKLLVDRGLIAR